MGLLEGLSAADPPLDLAAGRRAAGRSCGARWRPPPARASCAWSRTRSTRWCARTSRCFAAMRPDDTTTYGDLETGYIVTPTLPAGRSPPSPRPPKAVDAVATDPVREYAAQHPALRSQPASSSSRW